MIPISEKRTKNRIRCTLCLDFLVKQFLIPFLESKKLLFLA